MRLGKSKTSKGKHKDLKPEPRILAVFKNFEGNIMWQEYLPGNIENYVLDASEIPGTFNYIVNEERVIQELRDSLPPDISAVRLWVLSAAYNNKRQFCVVPHPKYFFDSSLLQKAPFTLQLELPVERGSNVGTAYIAEPFVGTSTAEIVVSKEVYEQLLQANTIHIRCKEVEYSGRHIPAYTEMEEED